MNKKITYMVTGFFLLFLSLISLLLLVFAFRDFSWILLGQFVFQIVSFTGAVIFVQHGLGLFPIPKDLLEEEYLKEFDLEDRFLLND